MVSKSIYSYYNLIVKIKQHVCIIKKGDDSTSKILIVYFSCYGTTKKFAKEIQEVVGGDLFEIEPVVSYDKDMSHYEELADFTKKRKR